MDPQNHKHAGFMGWESGKREEKPVKLLLWLVWKTHGSAFPLPITEGFAQLMEKEVTSGAVCMTRPP